MILTSLSGINALASVVDIHVISFADDTEKDAIAAKFREYWEGQPVKLQLLPCGKRASILKAFLIRRFQLGTMLEGKAIRNALNELEWNQPSCLVIFDDIVFAPLLTEFGQNAILSPHDCVSKMFHSHFKALRFGHSAFKLYFQYIIALHYEKHFYHLALLTHVVTHQDRVSLEAINPKSRYHVVSFGEWAALNINRTTEQLWDVLIWVNLSIAALAKNTRDFLLLARQDIEWWQRLKVVMVGRVSVAQAEQAVGKELLSGIDYASYLEYRDGRVKQAKIILIPDMSGAGIKSRCLSVLAMEQCLACLYNQMEGLEKACDRGAVNGSGPMELLNKMKYVLDHDTYQEIAHKGASIFRQYYSREIVQQDWLEMIERAVAIREYRTTPIGLDKV